MISYWEFTLPINYKGIHPIDVPIDVTWHEGPFKGHGAGLSDNKAPDGLQSSVLRFDEVTGVHNLMKNAPDYFFGTHSNLWIYTGGSGEVPDAIGFGIDGKVIVGEIKWLRGWHKELPHQIERYINLFSGKIFDRSIDIRIASAQTLSKSTKHDIYDMWKRLSPNWLEMSLHFGYLQVGWSNSISQKFYLRCKWEKQ